MKVAFSGLRHNHAAGLIKHLRHHPEFELVAVAESSPELCREIIAKAGIEVTHTSLEAMLDEVEFEILGICDIFNQRGSQALLGLEAGKHILGDKPICTSLAEIEGMRQLAKAKSLAVMAHLPLRYKAVCEAAKLAVADGQIGDIVTASITGRHPLGYGTSRPDWYFEPGLQGGTINDLFVHGIDLLEGVTGLRIVEVVSARAWNQQLPQLPQFQDGAQAMYRLENGAGVLMDASYTTPPGHKDPWTLQLSGTEGDLYLETSGTTRLRRAGEQVRCLELPEESGCDEMSDLLAAVAGSGSPVVLDTATVLRVSAIALMTQQAADQGHANVPVFWT